MQSQDDLFEMLFEKDEVTWQTMLYELVRSEEMNPWDINISLLAQRFLDMVRQLKEADFRISGKGFASEIIISLLSLSVDTKLAQVSSFGGNQVDSTGKTGVH